MLSFIFGNKEKVKWTEEVCKEEICNPNEGIAKIKCGKPLISINGKIECSINALHNIKGPPEK